MPPFFIEELAVRPLAVVEIAANARGEVPAAMLERLYRVSATGVVVLVLTEIGYETVDKALDDLVARMPHDIPGVRYFERTDRRAVESACRKAPAVFWKTEGFRSEASAFVDADRIFPIREIAISTGFRAIRAMNAHRGRRPRKFVENRQAGDEAREKSAWEDVLGTIN